MDNILQKAVSVIVEEIDPDKIILFGSRAYGKPSSESDYDIMIIKDFVGNHRKYLKKLYVKLFDIGAPIDLVLVKKDKIEQNQNNIFFFYKEAIEKGLSLYDKKAIG